jgi:hypothetical protein
VLRHPRKNKDLASSLWLPEYLQTVRDWTLTFAGMPEGMQFGLRC